MLKKLLIVGLGNPGKKYEKTRHNAGRWAVDIFQNKDLGENVIFFMPDSYMNNSGPAVVKKMKMNGIAPENLLVAHDDVDISLGEFKIKNGARSAGHNGVQSIIDALKTADFWRLRIGIGRPPIGTTTEDFVLEWTNKTDYDKIISVLESDDVKIEIKNIIDANN